MKIFLIMFAGLFFIGCDNCKEPNSCSSDSHNTTEVDDEDDSGSEEKENKVDVVIKDSDSLPPCDDENQNMTAYRKSSDKFFICQENAWEQFDGLVSEQSEIEKQSLDLKTLDNVWKEFKNLTDDETNLEILCAAARTVNYKFVCKKDPENEAEE